jgi:hypothetical protein
MTTNFRDWLTVRGELDKRGKSLPTTELSLEKQVLKEVAEGNF